MGMCSWLEVDPVSVLVLCTHPDATAKGRVRYEQDTFGEYDELSTGAGICRAEVAPQSKVSSAFCSRVNLFCAPKCTSL